MSNVREFPALPRREAPADAAERLRALDTGRSFLVQAPAGSGKTYLLTQRFLALLAGAESPSEIVAITFTRAAAAEMRQRILKALEAAERERLSAELEPERRDAASLEALAARALARSRRMGWRLLEQPEQLRVTTIDAFCKGLALKAPLGWGGLVALGGQLDPVEDAAELYQMAARRTMQRLLAAASDSRVAMETLLLWRDNSWKDVEELLGLMLQERNRWFQGFVFDRELEQGALRERLERPFQRAAAEKLVRLGELLGRDRAACEEILRLVRFAYGNLEQPERGWMDGLAELADLPDGIGLTPGSGEAAREALENGLEIAAALTRFLLTGGRTWRKSITTKDGFPSGKEGKVPKARFAELTARLGAIPGLEKLLGHFLAPVAMGYTDDEWRLIRACFAVLREAAGELQVVFAEMGKVDFTEVAQIALRLLAPEDGLPSDFAQREAEGIRHLLVDEFQDTSRKQHELLARLIGAWPEREGRTCFCVGDPMQSIYGFREAEVELFERLKVHGLDVSASDALAGPFEFEFVQLSANFRTEPSLVEDLNRQFAAVFGEDGDLEGAIPFSAAVPARRRLREARVELHVDFRLGGQSGADAEVEDAAEARLRQMCELVELIRDRLPLVAERQAAGGPPFRIAVLGRTRTSLLRVAEALKEAGIGFRALELVELQERPEVLDALAMVRAVLDPWDRTAWLGVLRAPWCGLSLEELHLLTSADEPEVMGEAVPVLLRTRLPRLYEAGMMNARAYEAALRVERVMSWAVAARNSAGGRTVGSWLASVWSALGGGDTVNADGRQNVELLWTAIDGLPMGELDLAGGGLASALKRLYALPDPSASSEFGVQLMTIHKSKGLEFEVVMVPELEAAGKSGERTMISWLERAGPEDADGAELTEFLIAPFSAKGRERGPAKAWVNAIKRERERLELKRVLYVAATRARDELHLFALPGCRRTAKTGELRLSPAKGLLASAWPAVGPEIEGRFAEWAARVGGGGFVGEVPQMAAVGSLELVQKAEGRRATVLRRLPEGYDAPGSILAGRDGRDERAGAAGIGGRSAEDETGLYRRSEGGLTARVEGIAVHALMERLCALRLKLDAEEASEALAGDMARITAEARSRGLAPETARRLAEGAVRTVQRVALSAVGAWITAPHDSGASEVQWTGMVRGRVWNLRSDRVFFSPKPGPGGEPAGWWIVDYKTGSGERETYAQQLATYAQVLRGLHPERFAGADEELVWVGLYFPNVGKLDSWAG